MKEFPKKIPYSLQSGIVCHRSEDTYALEGGANKDALYELTTRDKTFSVFDADKSSQRPASAIPLYSMGESGALVVPTGLIFVRFSSELDVRAMESSLRSIGYQIANEKTGHQSAAWLASVDGSVATSLANASQLADLPGIEEVQPQMLSQRAKR